MFSWNSWCVPLMVWRPVKWNCGLRSASGVTFIWNCTVFKLLWDILVLLSAFPVFINVKFVKFSHYTFFGSAEQMLLVIISGVTLYLLSFGVTYCKKNNSVSLYSIWNGLGEKVNLEPAEGTQTEGGIFGSQGSQRVWWSQEADGRCWTPAGDLVWHLLL